MAFRRFIDLIRHAQPEIHLVFVNTDPLFGLPQVFMEQVMDEFIAIADGFTCEKHIFKNFTVDAGIRAMSENIGADLIAISNHHRHSIKRIFSGSTVEAIVNHADLPVLSVDY